MYIVQPCTKYAGTRNRPFCTTFLNEIIYISITDALHFESKKQVSSYAYGVIKIHY